MSILHERNKKFLDDTHKVATKEMPGHRVAGVFYADENANVTFVWDNGLERKHRIGILKSLLAAEIQNQ